MSLLFSETVLGPLKLQNRLVMCPLTRSRTIQRPQSEILARRRALN